MSLPEKVADIPRKEKAAKAALTTTQRRFLASAILSTSWPSSLPERAMPKSMAAALQRAKDWTRRERERQQAPREQYRKDKAAAEEAILFLEPQAALDAVRAFTKKWGRQGE